MNESNPLMCPAVATLRLFNGKWKPMVLHRLSQESARFGELKRSLMPISHKVLTQQLRELESDGLVSRVVSDGPVVTVTYSLSVKGDSLAVVLGHLYAWGEAHL